MKSSDACIIGGTMDLAAELKERVEAEALAAEETAVYNLDLIRKLEKRATKMEQEIVTLTANTEHIYTKTLQAKRRASDAMSATEEIEMSMARKLNEQADAIAATSALVNELVTRIKHLGAVVYEEGEPEGHGLVEDVQ